MFNEYAHPFKFDMVSEFYEAPQDIFGNKRVLSLGGKYGIRYALVEK